MLTRWFPAAIACLAAATSTGCGAANDQVVAIVGALTKYVDTSKMCINPGDMPMMGMNCAPPMMTPFVVDATYDVGVATIKNSDLLLFPLITNRAMSRMVAQIDVNSVYLKSYDLELSFSPGSAVGAVIPASEKKKNVRIQSPLLTPNCMTYFFLEVPLISAALAAQIVKENVLTPGPTTTENPKELVIARLRYHYDQSGSEGVGNWFEFPVYLCEYCNATDPANPAASAWNGNKLKDCPAVMGNGTVFNDPCANSPAQGGPIACCHDAIKAKADVCGLDVPSM